MLYLTHQQKSQEPWNKGKLTGQKPPLKLSEIWAIRTRLQIGLRTRDLALFNLALDSKLRSCDLVKLRVSDVSTAGVVLRRAIVMQQKTSQPVQFDLPNTRGNLLKPGWYWQGWLEGTICSRVDCQSQNTFQRGNMRD